MNRYCENQRDTGIHFKLVSFKRKKVLLLNFNLTNKASCKCVQYLWNLRGRFLLFMTLKEMLPKRVFLMYIINQLGGRSQSNNKEDRFITSKLIIQFISYHFVGRILKKMILIFFSSDFIFVNQPAHFYNVKCELVNIIFRSSWIFLKSKFLQFLAYYFEVYKLIF